MPLPWPEQSPLQLIKFAKAKPPRSRWKAKVAIFSGNMLKMQGHIRILMVQHHLHIKLKHYWPTGIIVYGFIMIAEKFLPMYKLLSLSHNLRLERLLPQKVMFAWAKA